jgi:PA domain/FlgD Ig-like domain
VKRILLAALVCAALPCAARAATITVINNDAAGVGFNDATAVSPVGGNPGTTLGEQRLYVIQYAADLWGSILPSTVQIRIAASWGSLGTCTATSATLAGTSTGSWHQNFPGAPLSNINYNQALANKLAGADQSALDDMTITFNVNVDNQTCLGATDFYYGVDGNEGTDIELLATAFHEIGHGLGFSTQLTSAGTFSGLTAPTIMSHFVLDDSNGLHWDAMTSTQRTASVINTGNVVWDGPVMNVQGPVYLDPQRLVTVTAPAAIAGDYRVGVAGFGADVTNPVVTAPVVLADDGNADPSTSNACTALVNAVAGKIVLIDRGVCTFTAKALNAQNAGAAGVILVDNVSSPIAPDLGGTDPSITIPVVGLTQADGTTIRNQLANGVTATIGGQHATWRTGADLNGRIRIYAPSTFASGSSTSHWEISALPNLLMEPNITPSITAQADLTRYAFRDMGWFIGSTITGVPAGGSPGVRLASAPNPFDGRTTVAFRLDRRGPVTVDVFGIDGRRVRELARGTQDAGSHALVWDGRDDGGRSAPAGVYLVRLQSLEGTWSGRLVRLR